MKSPTVIVVVGTSGRLGKALESRLAGEAVVVPLNRDSMDLASGESIEKALLPLAFDFLVLPAAMTAVDLCETNPDQAYVINADAPGLIARICAAKGAHMTYVSTDFVFDGSKDGFYTEEDVPDPISVYGASKLKGEELVLAADVRNLVIRVSWLYGPGKPAFPEWIVEKACSETMLSLPGDKSGCPTSSVDVADLLVPLLFNAAGKPAEGIFHLCNSGACTWSEWGQACIDFARETGSPVKALSIGRNLLADIPAFLAKRPPNSSLDNSKYFAFTGIRPRPWEDALHAHFAACNLPMKDQ
ncbi:MAG: dTDP-4-dehydrorhamnose reductase [Methanosarcinaceae archaeon]|nr:dTDP-4-dehydrorhamnose reductase [Methanosarcinaceae archaeon]